MRRRKRAVRQKQVVIAVVLLASLFALFLPPAWTGRLITIAQVLVPFQDAAGLAADGAAGALGSSTDPVPAETHQAVQREREAAEHRSAALAVRLAELEREVAALTATRNWGVDGPKIGAAGRLIPARIIADDLLAWRSSRLISAGTLQGVRRGSPVASHFFTIDQGDDSGLRTGMAIVHAETFLGLVEQAGTHTSRVALVSDVSVEMKVRIGRLTDGLFVPLDRYFWLVGRGQGVMHIRDLDRREVESGVVAVGDRVLSDPHSDSLPSAMMIGTIVRIDPDIDRPLLATATVHSAADLSSLRRVYVYDPQGIPR